MVSYDLFLLMLKIESSTRGTNSMPFLLFRRDHLRSTSGIICGSGSFAVGDHLRCCTVLPIEKFPYLVLLRNAILLQHLIIQFTPYFLSSGRLREVKYKRKFQTFSAKSDRGRLREVVRYKRSQI